MARIAIYNDKATKLEKPLLLKLTQDGDDVLLVVMDEDGEHLWNILSITKEGKAFLHPAISDGIGLAVDENGRIKVERE